MNRFQLKLLMLFLMLLDHIGSFIPNTPLWLNYIGRIVAPVFFFLLVDGYFHTRDRYNYTKRLMVAGGIMTIGNVVVSTLFPMVDNTITPFMYVVSIIIIILLVGLTWFLFKTSAYNGKRVLSIGILFALVPLLFYDIFTLYNNIFLPMAFSIMVLNVIEYRKNSQNKTSDTVLIFGILAITLFTEGSILLPLMALIFYYFRDNRKKLSVWYVVLSLSLAIGNFSYQGLLIDNFQWMMVFALPFFFLYNGQKGKDLRYLFYGFYPLHVWILYSIGSLLLAG
ncbi:MAG TPA: TraX family protein [Clostridia bacterium]|nr:TraX family protein [Clostridia bacterium]